MKKIVLNISIVAAGLIFFVSCGDSEKPATNPDSVRQPEVSATINGEVLYQEKCMVCHGADGKQNTMGAADLSSSTLNHETVLAIISSGKNNMKAFSPELSDEQIDAVAEYAESLRK
ncbi:hypothetical protein BH11BAC7_BH11BAC7_36030 [soil metagenome]